MTDVGIRRQDWLNPESSTFARQQKLGGGFFFDRSCHLPPLLRPHFQAKVDPPPELITVCQSACSLGNPQSSCEHTRPHKPERGNLQSRGRTAPQQRVCWHAKPAGVLAFRNSSSPNVHRCRAAKYAGLESPRKAFKSERLGAWDVARVHEAFVTAQ
jgi:hypothetical protein